MTKQLWTKEEEDRLIMMAAQGKTNKQIAVAIGRTERAVAHKYAKLGIKKREPRSSRPRSPRTRPATAAPSSNARSASRPR